MHIYFSGIGGVGVGPLAEIATDAGHQVSGSDLTSSALTKQLTERGVTVAIGQDGSQIATTNQSQSIDWFVYTAALPGDHPELVYARDNGIRASKRDELLAAIIQDKGLKLIAVSGTHGKTTTTGMLVWAMKQLGIPVSYSVGTTISFGPSGHLDPDSQYFVYECDEFDRNFLHFSPYISLVTSIDHDHFDTYPTVHEYQQAFVQFIEQSDQVYMWERDLRYLKTDPRANIRAYDELMDLSHISLPGDHTRHNAFLVEQTLKCLLGSGGWEMGNGKLRSAPAGETTTSLLGGSAFPAGASQDVDRQVVSDERPLKRDSLVTSDAAVISSSEDSAFPAAETQDNIGRQLAGNGSEEGDDAAVSDITPVLNSFPGTSRRFEKLAENLYSDYGHHPVEIAATLQMAREISDHVVLVYQPHQNIRQHEVRDQYTGCMELAEAVYWLPTYLSREDPNLEILTPQQLSENLTNHESVIVADTDDELWSSIQTHMDSGHLVLVMGAGTVDGWIRSELDNS